MTTEKEERIASFIKSNPGLTALQIAEECDITRSRVYEIAKKYNLSYMKTKVGRPLKGMENIKYERTVCAKRPQSCFNCPYPDCICWSTATNLETSYTFLGLQKEEYKDKERKKLGVFK